MSALACTLPAVRPSSRGGMDGLPVLAFGRIGVQRPMFFMFVALCLCVRSENERLSQRHGGTKDGGLVRHDAPKPERTRRTPSIAKRSRLLAKGKRSIVLHKYIFHASSRDARSEHPFDRPYGTKERLFPFQPGDESPGYFHTDPTGRRRADMCITTREQVQGSSSRKNKFKVPRSLSLTSAR